MSESALPCRVPGNTSPEPSDNASAADVHGFRTSFRTWAQEQTNFPREVAEAALAHGIRDRSEAPYARSNHIEKSRKMMESWASYLAATRGEVVNLDPAEGMAPAWG